MQTYFCQNQMLNISLYYILLNIVSYQIQINCQYLCTSMVPNGASMSKNVDSMVQNFAINLNSKIELGF